MTFRQKLKDLRKQHGLSREELAKKLGLSYWAISKYEQGERFPEWDTLQKIADLFGVSVDYLLGRVDDRNLSLTDGPLAAHRTDDPLKELPEEARRSLEEFKEYILKKYGKKRE